MTAAGTFDGLEVLVDEGLGNCSYLVDLGDGRALAVDPSRDLRQLQAAAARRGLRIAFAVDTHLHADFVSGACQLAAQDDAALFASARGGREFPHHGLHDGDEVDLGGLRLRAIETAGHTDEHLAYLLLDGDAPIGVFSGGSLIVGAAARTDLVSPERTEELARAQFRSVQHLMNLPDHVGLWPTHGAGSFCSAPPGAERSSTIGQERSSNSLVALVDENAFVEALLGSLGSYPAYFRRLGEVNRVGPAVLPETRSLRALSVEDTQRLLQQGATLVDVRPIAAYAAAHVAGSVSIELRGAFATWLGWLVPADRPVVIVRDPDQDPVEILAQSAKVGYDELVGELAGGIAAWADAALPINTVRLLVPAEVGKDDAILDIRQAAEFASAHVPGASHIELGDLTAPTASLTGPVTVMCGHGERAMTGASLLERSGHAQPAVLLGGPQDWASAHGTAVETSP